MATAAAHAHFIELLRGFEAAMLVTHSAQGALHARPMLLAEVTPDGVISFVTTAGSPKVDELFGDSEVAVVMQAPEKYVALSGRAEIERNPAKIEELWNDSWQVWLGDDRDPDLVLIRVTGTDAEYWDHSTLAAARIAFRTARAHLAGEEPDSERELIETHARLTFS